MLSKYTELSDRCDFYRKVKIACTRAENKKGNLFMDCLFGSHVGLPTASSNQIMEDVEKIVDF